MKYLINLICYVITAALLWTIAWILDINWVELVALVALYIAIGCWTDRWFDETDKKE